jgi:hypothetical protein
MNDDKFDYQKTFQPNTIKKVYDGSYMIPIPRDCIKDKLITVFFHPHTPDGMKWLEAGGELFAIEPGTRCVKISNVSSPIVHIRLLFDSVCPAEHYYRGWYALPCECCTEDFECRFKVLLPSISGRFVYTPDVASDTNPTNTCN